MPSAGLIGNWHNKGFHSGGEQQDVQSFHVNFPAPSFGFHAEVNFAANNEKFMDSGQKFLEMAAQVCVITYIDLHNKGSLT
jgi:hypothetical protein